MLQFLLLLSLAFEQGVGTHEFGTKATAAIPCSDANINNEGCWDCYKNNGAACLAKQWGRQGMVAGVCTGKDEEYWNYKCVSTTGMENEVGGIIQSSCPGLSCSRCVSRHGCTFAEGHCWDGRYIPMGTRFFVRNAADCPKPKPEPTYSSQEDDEYYFAEDEIEQGVGTHEFGTKATAAIPCSDANINNEGCWDCYKNNGAACLAKQWGRQGMVAGVCTGKDEEYWNYKCVSTSESAVGLVGPSWTFGAGERPAGKEKHGSSWSLVFTEEQQKRLGVDKFGEKRNGCGDAGSCRACATMKGCGWQDETCMLASETQSGLPMAQTAAECKALKTCVDDEAKVRDDAFDPLATCANQIEAYKEFGIDLCAPDSTFRKTCCATCKTQSTDESAVGLVGPSWTFGAGERPAGKEKHGSSWSLVYTEEQQNRLGVDKFGQERNEAEESVAVRRKPCRACRTVKCRENCFNAEAEESVAVRRKPCRACRTVKCRENCFNAEEAVARATPPPRQGCDVCIGYYSRHDKDPASVTARCQLRGYTDCTESAVSLVGPSWTFGARERPAGKENHGSSWSLVYTEEQQKRLGVDKFGQKRKQDSKTMLGANPATWSPKPMLGGNPATWSPKPMLGGNPATWSPNAAEGEFVALAPKSSISVHDFVMNGFALLGLGFLLFQGVKTCRKQKYTELAGNEQSV